MLLQATDSSGGFVESEFIVTVGEAALLFNDGFETGVLQDHWRVVGSGSATVVSSGVEGGRSLQIEGGLKNVIVELDVSEWSNVTVEYSVLHIALLDSASYPEPIPEHYTSLDSRGD